MDDDILDKDYKCPITLEYFIDPVVASDGHTYERLAIEEWFFKNNYSKNIKSPMTGKIMKDTILFKNNTLIKFSLPYRIKRANFIINNLSNNIELTQDIINNFPPVDDESLLIKWLDLLLSSNKIDLVINHIRNNIAKYEIWCYNSIIRFLIKLDINNPNNIDIRLLLLESISRLYNRNHINDYLAFWSYLGRTSRKWNLYHRKKFLIEYVPVEKQEQWWKELLLSKHLINVADVLYYHNFKPSLIYLNQLIPPCFNFQKAVNIITQLDKNNISVQFNKILYWLNKCNNLIHIKKLLYAMHNSTGHPNLFHCIRIFEKLLDSFEDKFLYLYMAKVVVNISSLSYQIENEIDKDNFHKRLLKISSRLLEIDFPNSIMHGLNIIKNVMSTVNNDSKCWQLVYDYKFGITACVQLNLNNSMSVTSLRAINILINNEQMCRWFLTNNLVFKLFKLLDRKANKTVIVHLSLPVLNKMFTLDKKIFFYQLESIDYIKSFNFLIKYNYKELIFIKLLNDIFESKKKFSENCDDYDFFHILWKKLQAIRDINLLNNKKLIISYYCNILKICINSQYTLEVPKRKHKFGSIKPKRRKITIEAEV